MVVPDFGFSVGDIIAVGLLAWQVYLACSKSPSKEFKELVDSCSSVYIAIKGLETSLEEKHQALTPQDAADLTTLCKNCNETLTELDSKLKSYSSLAFYRRAAWDRWRFQHEDLGVFRSKLTVHLTAISAFVDGMQLDVMDRIEQRLSELAISIARGDKEPSLLSEKTLEDDDVWTQLLGELADHGITLEDLEPRRTDIKALVMRLVMDLDLTSATLMPEDSISTVGRVFPSEKLVARNKHTTHPVHEQRSYQTTSGHLQMLPSEMVPSNHDTPSVSLRPGNLKLDVALNDYDGTWSRLTNPHLQSSPWSRISCDDVRMDRTRTQISIFFRASREIAIVRRDLSDWLAIRCSQPAGNTSFKPLGFLTAARSFARNQVNITTSNDTLVAFDHHEIYVWSSSTTFAMSVEGLPATLPVTLGAKTEVSITVVDATIYFFGGEDKTDHVDFGTSCHDQSLHTLRFLGKGSPGDARPPHVWYKQSPTSAEWPCGRKGHSLSVFGKAIILFGGSIHSKHSTDGHLSVVYLNDLWVYDTVRNVWHECKWTGPGPSPRTSHGAAVVGSRLYIIGGKTEQLRHLADVWILEVKTMKWYQPDVRNWGWGPSGDLKGKCAVVGHEIVVIDGSRPPNPGTKQPAVNMWLLDASALQLKPSGTNITRVELLE